LRREQRVAARWLPQILQRAKRRSLQDDNKKIMRLDINLASQPYEDARQFWMRWGTALVAASIVTLVLIATTVSGWLAARHDHATVAGYRGQIAQRDLTRQQAEAYLNRPENRSTRDQSQFINGLIERKALSWTRVLEDLEKVMPSRVHVVSIAPTLDEDNQLNLKLVIGGDSRDKAIELAQRMEESKHFTQTYIETERSANDANGDRVQFDINGIYVPETEAALTPAPAPNANGEKSKGSQP
jgi:type IV pilus assembly protein PilN